MFKILLDDYFHPLPLQYVHLKLLSGEKIAFLCRIGFTLYDFFQQAFVRRRCFAVGEVFFHLPGVLYPDSVMPSRRLRRRKITTFRNVSGIRIQEHTDGKA